MFVFNISTFFLFLKKIEYSFICRFNSLSDSSCLRDLIILNEEFKKIHKSGLGKKFKINLVKFLDKLCL